MLHRHPHDRTPVKRSRYPVGNTHAPAHFARQIDAALRLAPVEALRGHTAVMLYCCEPTELRPAEQALRDVWTLDAVHPVRCPIESWTQAIEDRRGTDSWLRHCVMREIHELEPTVLAILDCGRAEDGRRTADSLIALVRGWGASHPVAVLRLRQGEDEVDWLATPGAALENTG